MATPISSLRDVIRLILGDSDPDIPEYSNEQLDGAVKLVVMTGKAPGYSIDGAEITPAMDATEDPSGYAKVIFYAAKRFAVNISARSIRTRAASFSRAEGRELVLDILVELADLEGGEGIY